jgi:hypothetical protein
LLELAQFGGGEDRVDSREPPGLAGIDPDDAGMCLGASQAGAVEHARRLHIIDEAPEPPQQPGIPTARHPGADHVSVIIG